jgi:anti-sigma factor RsiW
VGISCEEVWRDLSDYIDDELGAAQKALLDAHFAECRRCSAVLAGTRNIIGVYRDDRLLAMPEVYRERLQDSLRARTAPPRRAFLK